MNCPRCHGLMVEDLCCDLAETQGMWVTTTRCMNCGHVIYPPMAQPHPRERCAPAPGKTLSRMAANPSAQG
ncbi:MAG: hypothetical protein K0S45_3261 [Nitrospira sp.]|jgi:hypothetical protein|nr:hypothetical protein [Nitrospira sp.]